MMKRKCRHVMLRIMALTLVLTTVSLSGCGDKGQTGEQVVVEMKNPGGDAAGETDAEQISKEQEEEMISDQNPEEQEQEPKSQETEEEVPILRDAVEKELGGYIGTCISGQILQDKKLWNLVTTHYNAVTLENELKPDCMFGYSNARCPGTEEITFGGEIMTVPKLDYSRAEKLLDKVLLWNQDNPEKQIKVRGHVLVWHSQTPEWFFHENYDKTQNYVSVDEMNKRLEWYICSVLTHFTGPDSKYHGMFYGWDVVNEAISDATGSYRTEKENPDEPLSNDTHGNNSSWWAVYQSNEYIINAFRYANQYAPQEVELYYNDYNECSSKKSLGIVELLKAVKEQEGVPGEGTRIDGMGMQGHYSVSGPSFSEFETAISRYAAVVGQIQLTEVDMKASDDYDGSDEAKEAEYKKMAQRYQTLYFTLKNKNAQDDICVGGITFWGTVDHYSWLQSRSNVGGGSKKSLPQCPLLFDEHYQPKPAFYVFAGGEE